MTQTKRYRNLRLHVWLVTAFDFAMFALLSLALLSFIRGAFTGDAGFLGGRLIFAALALALGYQLVRIARGWWRRGSIR